VWGAPLTTPLLLWGLARGSDPLRRLAAAWLALLAVAFAFFYNLGQVEFSTRYLLAAWGLAMLPAGAVAARWLPGRWRLWALGASGGLGRRPAGARAAGWRLGRGGLWALVALAAWRGWGQGARSTVAAERGPREGLESQGTGGAVVFVRGTPNRYARACVRNL